MSGTGLNGDGLTTEELRAAVRAVLRDVLPSPTASGETVVLRTDAELDAFVRRVAALCADPGRRGDLAAGRHGFRLAAAAAPVASPPAGPVDDRAGPADDRAGHVDDRAGQVIRVDRGAVTERIVLRAAKEGAHLVLGRGAVLTPLARDRARVLGVGLERESAERTG